MNSGNQGLACLEGLIRLRGCFLELLLLLFSAVTTVGLQAGIEVYLGVLEERLAFLVKRQVLVLGDGPFELG